jgi:hypothetical protein
MGEAYAVRYPEGRDKRWKKKHVSVRLEADTDNVSRVGFTTPGCLAIFADCARTTGGNMWPWFCDDCRSDHRQPVRDEGRAEVKRIKKLCEGHGATVYSGTFHTDSDDG